MICKKRKLLSIILIAAMMIILLSACGGANAPRNGTYVSEGFLTQTWTFFGNNEITLSTIGGLVSTSGTWSISGNTITIESSLWGVETTQTNTITEITRNSFRIDGTLFTRQ